MKLGALEAGGTKMVCAIGDETGKILDQVSISTLTPEETMPKIIDYFQDKDIEALGVAAFGPVDVNPESPNYGRILDTPKLAWRQYPLLSTLKEALAVPIKLDTDVNGSCLGEMTYGSAKGLDSVMYITIGTGIGVGIAIGGKLVHGMLHPEAGHILITPQTGDEEHCVCPYHKNCLEGLASGPSIEKRWGTKAVNLVDKTEVWELESEYLAQAIMNFILTVSPQRIILGGGVMHQEQLLPLIRKKVQEKMNGYIRTPELADMDHYIVPASLNDDQGILGCIRLAELSLK
ncbi:MAG: ROK family protein [Lachnospiraceae bacterium]|nr:ROK family protein [Lachnospiraceae bacterium]